MADDLTPGPNEFSADDEQKMREANRVPLPTPDPRTPQALSDAMAAHSKAVGAPPEKWSTGQLSSFQKKFGVTAGRPRGW